MNPLHQKILETEKLIETLPECGFEIKDRKIQKQIEIFVKTVELNATLSALKFAEEDEKEKVKKLKDKIWNLKYTDGRLVSSTEVLNKIEEVFE